MLSEKARSAVYNIMAVGCFFKVFPYGWNAKKFRLTKATRLHNVCFRIHGIFLLLNVLFLSFRCIQTLNAELPSRLRVMNIIWALAFWLTNVCVLQFELRREEIMFFINSMFEAKEKMRDCSIGWNPNPPKGSNKKDWVSLIIVVSTALLITNPTTHAAVLFYGPCVPQYLSSVIHDCPTATHMPLSFLEAIPYVAFEHFMVGDTMLIWTFNWVILFLGFLWVKIVLNGEDCPGQPDGQMNPRIYRLCQVLVVLINDSFALYLTWFPSIFFTIAGMLLFCAIRYTNITVLLYLVFPACGLRCLFEASTALGAAGWLNQKSTDYLTISKRKLNLIEESTGRKFMRAFHKSCQTLHCTAGPLYTFENSIVLVSLDNCTQLTFNMLVTYPAEVLDIPESGLD